MKLSRILFLTDDREDYLADGLLHGIRQLSEIEVIDYPQKGILYSSSDIDSKRIRGGGFTLYKLLDDPHCLKDRSQIWHQLEAGLFDAVILSNIWRQWGLALQWKNLLEKQTLILLDGDDDTRYYPNSLKRMRDFGIGNGLKQLLSRSKTYIFKREWSDQTSHFMPRDLKIYKTSFAIPDEKILKKMPEKVKNFPVHIVDTEMAVILGRQTNYAFDKENDYRLDLAHSKFGITSKRAGWDCLRHYEIAAAGAVPCFRDLQLKPEKCAPHGLVDRFNCISYSNAYELIEILETINPVDVRTMGQRSLKWASKNSTSERARDILRKAEIL